MRKTILSILLIACFIFIGCGKEESATEVFGSAADIDSQDISAVPTLEDLEQIEQSGTTTSVTDETEITYELINIDTEELTDDFSNIDIDLTAMSSTAVYAEVYNMVQDPASNNGIICRMSGLCSVYKSDTTIYYACYVSDAAGCCATGIEFLLDDVELEDYPEPGEEITVVGTLTSYEENGSIYQVIANAYLE